MSEVKIYITHCDINSNKDDMFKIAKDDVNLIKAINRFSVERKKTGEEIFSKKHNMIITESGYYFAFYEDDLELAEK